MSDPEGRLVEMFNQLNVERALADDAAILLERVLISDYDDVEIDAWQTRYREARNSE
jgi:hypothetical protein